MVTAETLARMRWLQRRMLYIGVPMAMFVLLCAFLLRDVDAKTFFIAPQLEAGAVRSVLKARGMREVERAEKATIVWTDMEGERTLALAASAVYSRRVSAISGVVAPRPDAACRVLVAAREHLNASTCFVLPHQEVELKRTMVEVDGGRSLWELEPADGAALVELEVSEAAGQPLALIINNPEALPRRGAWAARQHQSRPYLLGGRRFALQLFAIVTGVEPLRVFLHQEGVIWRAARPYRAQALSVDPDAQRTGPRRLSHDTRGIPIGASQPPPTPGELWPIASLWRAVGASGVISRAELWERLERAAAASVVASLSPTAGARPREPPERAGFSLSSLWRAIRPGSSGADLAAAATARGFSSTFQVFSVRAPSVASASMLGVPR